MSPIEGKWHAPGDLPAEAESLRQRVFGRGRDALDELSWNALICADGVPAATGRIFWRDGAFWLDSIAVEAAFRGQKLGDLTLRLLLFKAQSHAARELRLFSPDSTTGFFARLGFRADGVSVNGTTPMLLMGSDLCLDTCKGCHKDCPNRQ